MNLDSPNYSSHMIGLGLIFALLTIAFLSILGIFAGFVGAWLKSKRTVAGKFRLASGLVLMLLGRAYFHPIAIDYRSRLETVFNPLTSMLPQFLKSR